MLIIKSMHLITCISGHICNPETSELIMRLSCLPCKLNCAIYMPGFMKTVLKD